MPTVGSTVMLDRLGPKRSDADFLKSKLEAPGARFLVLADLKPVIRSNAQRTEAKLAWFSRENLTGYRVPKLVEFRDSLPETLVGKVLRRVLQQEEKDKATATSGS